MWSSCTVSCREWWGVPEGRNHAYVTADLSDREIGWCAKVSGCFRPVAAPPMLGGLGCVDSEDPECVGLGVGCRKLWGKHISSATTKEWLISPPLGVHLELATTATGMFEPYWRW